MFCAYFARFLSIDVHWMIICKVSCVKLYLLYYFENETNVKNIDNVM